MNRDIYDKVKKFNETFKVPLLYQPSAKPLGQTLLGFNLMEEENNEYLDAVLADDKVEVFDALLDQMFINIGNFQKHGFSFMHIVEGMEEVYLSNMSKLDKDGSPIFREDGKVIKSEDYFKPNLAPIIE